MPIQNTINDSENRSYGFEFELFDDDNYGLTDAERRKLTIEPTPLPIDWAEKNFFLSTGYSNPGIFKAYGWQKFIINAIAEYDTVILCLPVQVGKSLIAEVILFYLIDTDPMNAICVYAKQDTVKDVFDERLRPAIREIPILRRHWNGDEDNLTIEKISLQDAIIRTASAQVPKDIATFASGIVYASEVSKYRLSGTNPNDVIKMLKGRYQSYLESGRRPKMILESSPYQVGDVFFNEMFKPSVLVVRPHYPCPTCGHYQILTLEQIKERPNQKGECDHDPERIRNDNAAQYICVRCNQEIKDSDRVQMDSRVVWAASDEVISADGKILNRKKKNAIAFQAGRLVSYSYKFSEHLARFFEAQRSKDPNALRTFLNEDCGEFWEERKVEVSTEKIMQRIKPYKISDSSIPDRIEYILGGMDTQDNGFYFVWRGFGAGMESWFLDGDFIPCSFADEYFKDPERVKEQIEKYLYRKQMKTGDGSFLEHTFGLIDRGGHRAAQVDYFVANNRHFGAYFGAKDDRAPLIKTNADGLFTGNKRQLSRIAGKWSEGDNWHLPEDVPMDYVNQFPRQYEVEEFDRYGNVKTKWVELKNDHFRDCENLIAATAFYLGLEEKFSGDRQEREEPQRSVPQQTRSDQYNHFATIQNRWRSRNG